MCVGDPIVAWGRNGHTVKGIAEDGIRVSTTLDNDLASPDVIGVKKKYCFKPNPILPKVCEGDSVIAWGRKGIIVTGINLGGRGVYTSLDADLAQVGNIGITTGCGTTNPKFCVGDKVTAWGRGPHEIVGINATGIGYFTTLDNDLANVSNLTLISRAKRTGLDSLNVSMGNEHQDIIETYGQFAKVVTRERAGFAKSLQSQVASLKSGYVDVFSGLLLAKLVRLSTAQVIKDSFEPAVVSYLAEMEKQNWKSVMQVPLSDETVLFAIQVTAAGVRMRNTQAGVSPESEIRLKTLAAAAAKKGTVAKANALRNFLMSNMVLIEDLVADPRHGAIGSLVADTAQWVNKQFEE